MGVERRKKINTYSRKYIVCQEVTNDMKKMECAGGDAGGRRGWRVEGGLGHGMRHGRSVLYRKVSVIELHLS